MKHNEKKMNFPTAYGMNAEENEINMSQKKDMDYEENEITLSQGKDVDYEENEITLSQESDMYIEESNIVMSQETVLDAKEKEMKPEDRRNEKTPEIYHLIYKAKKGDVSSQNKIVEENIGLVWSVVQRFKNRGYEKEDLFQIGCIGLIKAIRRFDLTMNVKFSTYAVPMIMGEIKRFMRDDGMIKVSRSLKELGNKIKLEQEFMTKQLGRQPTVNELAEKLNVEKEEIVMAIESCYQPESLYSTVSESENSPIYLIDKLKGDEQLDESAILDKIDLGYGMKGLQERQKKILILRYVKEQTQMEVAKELGISQVQVSRLEKKLLKDIRNKMDISIET